MRPSTPSTVEVGPASEAIEAPGKTGRGTRGGSPRVTAVILLGLAAAAVVLGPVSVLATVGDDRTIELLGFEPRERKLFARSHGDPERECTLLVADLRRGREARFAVARRITESEDCEERVEALAARLVRLRRVPASEATVRITRGERRRVWDSWIEARIVRRTATVEVAFRGATGRGEFDVIESGYRPQDRRPRVSAEVFEIPGERIAVAVVRAFTDAFELGYFVDTPIFLHEPAPTP